MVSFPVSKQSRPCKEGAFIVYRMFAVSEEGTVPAAEPGSLCEGITASWDVPAAAESHLSRGRLLSCKSKLRVL